MDLLGEERGQSIQIGAVLLFASLIILFATYQAFVVPNQNQKVEFNHNQQVQSEMVELRNSILSSKTSGQEEFVSVKLGSEFPPRLIALNPAPPSGRLATTENRPVIVEEIGSGTEITDDVCPGSDIQTHAVEYTPNYAVYQNAGTIRYENSLLYNDFGEETTTLTGQNLVQGNRLQLIPLNRSFNRGGSQRTTLDLKPGLVDTSQREDINVTLPTELNEAQWEEALDGEVAPQNVVVTEGAAGRNLTVTLTGEVTIDCGPVGLGESPASGARGSGTIDEINPASPGNIRLQSEERSGSTFSLFFNNTAGTNNFTEGRVNFYDAQGNGPSEADISKVGEPVSATLQVRGDFKQFDPDISLEGNNTVTEVTLDFDNNPNPNDWFIITFQLETGERALYFVPAS
jgi:hypothetical protein